MSCNIDILSRAIYAALGHVKPDYRSPKRLDDAARTIATFIEDELEREKKLIVSSEPVGWFNPWNDYHGFQQVADEYAGKEGTLPFYAVERPEGPN